MDNCPKCGSEDMEQCYNAFERVTTGWWCRLCNHFERAIGRERKFGLGESTYTNTNNMEYPETVINQGDSP